MSMRITFAATLTLCTQMAIAQVTFPVERPTVAVGERIKAITLDGFTKVPAGWREETVTAIDAIGVHIDSKSDTGAVEKAVYDAEWNRLADIRGRTERQVKFSFPLEAGKKWSSTYAWINARGNDGRMEIAYTVRGTETITVPAGTFDTVVIDGRGFWRNTTFGSSGSAAEVLWYAPKAKRWVRRTWATKYSHGGLDQNYVTEATEVDVKP